MFATHIEQLSACDPEHVLHKDEHFNRTIEMFLNPKEATESFLVVSVEIFIVMEV